MKHILEYRQLLGATANTSLEDLARLYKSLMKTHHPDRHPTDPVAREQAEETSKRVIEAYHFLVSIAPETHAKDSEEHARVTNQPVLDWRYEQRTLRLTFADGTAYEYFGVPHNVWNKFLAADGNARFVRRNIHGSYPFRRARKADAPVHA